MTHPRHSKEQHWPIQAEINATSRSGSWRGRKLSNFSADPFMLDGTWIANVEAFVQGIKEPDEEARDTIFQMAARKAKDYSPAKAPETIEWNGLHIPFRSLDHYRLQAAAIVAKFDQNEEAREALLATGSLPLVHDLGRPERKDSALPAGVFADILKETRAVYFREIGKLTLSDEHKLVYVTDEDPRYREHVYVTDDVLRYARGEQETFLAPEDPLLLQITAS